MIRKLFRLNLMISVLRHQFSSIVSWNCFRIISADGPFEPRNLSTISQLFLYLLALDKVKICLTMPIIRCNSGGGRYFITGTFASPIINGVFTQLTKK